MNWLYDILSTKNDTNSIEQMLVSRLPDFLYASVPDITWERPTTSELINNLIRHDLIIHPSTGNIMTSWDVNKLIKDRISTVSHNMAQETAVRSNVQPIVQRGLLPTYQSPGWAKFLPMI